MPWRRGWPPYVSRQVVEDRQRAAADLEQSSGDLKEAADRALRAREIAGRLRAARRRNHFSEGMEALFAERAERLHHQPRGTAT